MRQLKRNVEEICPDLSEEREWLQFMAGYLHEEIYGIGAILAETQFAVWAIVVFQALILWRVW